MKHALIILTIIGLSCIAIAWIGATEMYDANRVLQSEIDGLKKELTHQEDSLKKELKLTRDSLKTALYTILLKHEETLKAKEVSRREIKKLKDIVFVQHTDSSRTKELKQLYKTY